ncbi:choice-of-anchor D domain-containing protein [Luteolibacter yonseiensis]|uniref:Choice-of-anchor D domain-containing protein n=1 Tax=Luteolibacter yonseiensis TaxID=1144680 RepID=A0A934R036_9BACT|nr:choice-of-anchor D domain-containing protein [Luteolibacter yonseiensis]MBK1814274.1 choice-of-anchor D domain-containing protein [Luteolibacter yonseiensis]
MKHHSLLQLLKGFAAACILAASTGAAVAAAPEIVVEQPAGTNVSDGGSVNYGSIDLGTNKPLTFTIKNTGDADLTGLAVTKSGANQSDFAISGTPTSPLTGPSGTTTFTVTFNPTAKGARTAEIQIANNDADEGPFNITLNGTALAPEIVVEQSGTGINDGGSKAFGNSPVGTPVDLSFTIKNTGDADLTGLALYVDGTNSGDFTVTAAPTAPVSGPSGSTNFTVRFTPSGIGNRSAVLHIPSNDSDEDSFEINLSGTGQAAEIVVLGRGASNIADAGSQAFSQTMVGGFDKITFTIQNSGNLDLTGLTVTKDGANPGDFVIASNPTAPVAASAVTTFDVLFQPTAAGARTATLHIASNDPDENPFDITLTGTGAAPPSGSDSFGYKLASTPVNAFSLKTSDPDVVTAGSLSGDDYYQSVNIGFTFFLYDKAYTSLAASTNGLLTFGSESAAYSPHTIPNSSAPNNYVAPFWTDLVKGAGSNILYATRGSAPNRTFIIDYQDMEEYANSAARVSFQVILYEGSNSIEIQYKKFTGFTTGRNVTVGIENFAGSDGIQYTAQTARPIPPGGAPTAIIFTRPVIVDVVSKFTRPDGSLQDVGTLSSGLNPEIGVYKEPYGASRRYEAPEFIYLDKDFAVLPAAGEVTDANPAWYRLVNDGYALDGQVVQGAQKFFATTLSHDVTIIWRWRLEYAAVVESGKPNGGSVNGGGRFWYKPGDQFTAIIDNPLDGLSESAGMRLIVQGYSLFDKTGAQMGVEIPVTAGAFVSSNPLSMSAPVRLKWRWAGQVRYRLDARSSGVTSNLLNSQSFLRVYKPDRTTVDATYYGNGADMPVWVNVGSKVEAGAFYRSLDRRWTLTDFAAPPGADLAPIGSSVATLADSTAVLPSGGGAAQISRIFTVQVAMAPTDIHWLYGPTVFRAEVPLGKSFDPKSPDIQLVPDLATGGVLKVLDGGPNLSIDAKINAPEGSTMNGAALRWDPLAKELFPVQPGSYRLNWADASGSAETYTVEIVTTFPGDSAPLVFPREDEDGRRQGVAPNYVVSTPPLELVSSDFPAAPAAHYRHLYDPLPTRRPPTKLDISATDEWAFQEMPYAEKGMSATVATTVPGVPYSTSGTGRSVVLFSYRANIDEVADGDLAKENLAVRVVQSTPVGVITRNDQKLVLGRHALQLGSGSAPGGVYGIVQNGSSPATTSINPGDKFVVDFWLNAKGLKTSTPITLANCVTVSGSTAVTCATTANVQAGMGINGTNIPAGTKIASVTNGTTLQLSTPATANGTALSLSATNKPVTVVSTGGGGLKVTLDPEGATVTADYRGVKVTHPLPKAGVSWKHYVIHVFTNSFFGVDVAMVDFYLDGLRQEKGFVTGWLPTAVTSTVGSGLTANSLRFGVDATASQGLLLDNFRIFNLGTDPEGYLNAGELRRLRTERDMTVVGKRLRNVGPLVSFHFEDTPLAGRFSNQGSLPNIAVGTVAGSTPYAGKWADTDLQEVATKLESTLDNAAFSGSGYVLNPVSNYNVDLYNRAAEIGTWGPVFPINDKQLFTEVTKKLEVAYYENPYLTDRKSNPNVSWPYIATEYKDVTFPALGPNKDKAIYIASRIGSEGVDQKGFTQPVFDLADYADLKIYQQPDRTLAGYNPNEEHALVAPANRAALKVKNLGEDVPNNPPLAAFALQRDINTATTIYTSDPWVLVQVNNLATGEPEMAAYQVFKTRTGATAFPRPSTAVVNTAGSGLAYEAASVPEDGFLTMDPAKSLNFSYQFDYPVFAGDLLIPPYPLNIVIGNVPMRDARGNSLQVNGVNQRTLWRDVNSNAWVVSGGGQFFHQFFYPFRSDFYLAGATAGVPVAWLPDDGRTYTGTGTSLNPVKVNYTSYWRKDYPKLKRGETLTYQGGEYFNETPGSNGLPALVAMASAEVIYDSSTPSMVYGPTATNSHDLSKASARIIRPLDRRENPFTVAQMGGAGFTPAATAKVFIVAERWYFKELPGSLQKRFYFDSLAAKLVFRGRLNDKESGDSNLTAGPDPLNILEPNVLTKDDYTRLRALSSDSAWRTAIDNIYLKVQNPEDISSGNTNASAAAKNLQGVKPKPSNYPNELGKFWIKNGSTYTETTSPTPTMVPLDSFGVGSALVPSPTLLTQNPNGSIYITIAENNRTELVGAPISLHIIEIIPDRYRGAIKVIEGSDAFSEKVTLQHNGEFGANTADLYYEWWIRDAAPLDVVAQEVLANGTLTQTSASGQSLWQEYIPTDRASETSLDGKHLGLNSVVFEGRPDVVLADKLVLMRYRHRSESNWKLVPFEFANASVAWKPGSVLPVTAAPFQWAGAANSPQLQADGSKRYIPQLVMGWVKRVLDRINPYEARYADFFSNESPATYSSQIQIAGAPYAGNVALNPSKNVIENTGLIELYRTVLERAKELSIDNSSNGNTTDGINQALLLAATRLSVLYELLGNEAYSDAQDSTINSGEDAALSSVASFTHAFQNMESDLQHEELSLLRGTDFGKSYPIYNRMFWNYAKGLGEAAYNVNYNIYDVNTDGFINEDDARKLYPQGHGDAWGHYVSALDMHYTLLQHSGFSWKTRSELYSLMQNVLEVDFLDEKTFARLGAERARAGRDIVRNTYRLNYTQNPDGQWQGYTDGADPARAWGVSEWAHRAGQASHFDWVVANALLPEDAGAATPVTNPENLDRIERSGAIDEIGAIAGGLHEIQVAMDEANSGVNPLGLDSDAFAFDIELQFYNNASGGDRRSQFEQIYTRALDASANALTTLDMATQSGNKLRSLADDTDGLIQEAMAQDLDFRNRLIEIFGRPYDGTIGVGKAYPEGYLGPDTLLYAYLDKTKISEIVPERASSDKKVVTFDTIYKEATGIMNKKSMVDLYKGAWDGSPGTKRTTAFETLIGNNNYRFENKTFTAPYTTASKYAFQSLPGWGTRTSYGRVQASLQDMLADEIELDSAISDYIAYLRELENKLHRIDSQLAIFQEKNDNHDEIAKLRKKLSDTVIGLETAFGIVSRVAGFLSAAMEAGKEAIPEVVGFSFDATSVPRGVLKSIWGITKVVEGIADTVKELSVAIVTRDAEANEYKIDLRNEQLDQVAELEGMIEEFQSLAGAEQSQRNAIGAAIQNMEVHRQEYITAQAEGFRLLREREAFNKILAAKVQKNRYQDMIFRLSRNEAMSKYQSSFDAAARYAWLAARAYDYETSLDPGHPAAPGSLLDKIVKERQLGAWADGVPQIGHGGLAEILAQLKGNFNVLKGQLGISNPQEANEKISLRSELFRINTMDSELSAAQELKANIAALNIPESQLTMDQRLLLATLDDEENQAALAQGPASDDRWKDALKARIVPDLNTMPEFVRHCRPFATGVQPGLVIRFSTTIETGKNLFGLPLIAGDHSYSTANFATKIQALGVWLDNYNAAGLSISPRAYLVPLGTDYLRNSTASQPITRAWNIVEQRIPTPYLINAGNISSPNYIPTLNGVDGSFSDLRRHGDFRMYHDNGDPEADDSELIMDSRLISRSVWNSQWMLVIPGAGLDANPEAGLQKLTDNISDIKLYFLTYSHQGQ